MDAPQSRMFGSIIKTYFSLFDECSDSGRRQDLATAADSAIQVAVEALTIASSVTQAVPYLGAITGALTAILNARDVRIIRHKFFVFAHRDFRR
jgi:hypothetical protein